MLFFLFCPAHWESQMKALRALLHSQNHYCQQKSIADLEVVTSIHLFIFRHFAIQLREEKLLLYFLSTKFLFNNSFNNHIKVSWRCYVIPLLFIMNPSSPSVNTRGQLSRPVIPGFGGRWKISHVSKQYSMMYKSFLFRSKYKCRKGEWKPDKPTCLSIRWNCPLIHDLNLKASSSDLPEPASGPSLVSWSWVRTWRPSSTTRRSRQGPRSSLARASCTGEVDIENKTSKLFEF